MPGAARGGLGVVRMNEAANASPLRQTFTPFMLALDSRVRGGNAQRIRLHLPFAPATCLRGGDATDLRAVASLLDHAGGAAVYAALPDLKATATLEINLLSSVFMAGLLQTAVVDPVLSGGRRRRPATRSA